MASEAIESVAIPSIDDEKTTQVTTTKVPAMAAKPNKPIAAPATPDSFRDSPYNMRRDSFLSSAMLADESHRVIEYSNSSFRVHLKVAQGFQFNQRAFDRSLDEEEVERRNHVQLPVQEIHLSDEDMSDFESDEDIFEFERS